MRAYEILQRLMLAVLVGLVPFAHAQPAQRVALLIGNANYQVGRLTNPPQDVQAMENALVKLGFKVQKILNANQNQMKRAARDFGAAAQGAEIAFLYYSGHGTQANGENYLLPIGAIIDKESDYAIEAIAANDVLLQIRVARPKAAILVLDACRDNPLAATTRSSTKGLGRMDAPTGTMIAFATAPNTVASDNGDYAKVLSRELQKPGQELIDVFRNTTAEVRRLSSGKQEPRISEMSITERVYLAGPGIQIASVSTEPTSRLPQYNPEEDAWAAAKSANTAAGYGAYLDEYPNGRYASVARVARASLGPTAAPQGAPQRPAQTAGREPSAAGQVFKDCADCPEMVVIPVGSYQMGSNDGFAAEKPVHSVSVNSFALGKYEVTQGQWKAVMGNNPSEFKQCGDTCPVENVSWDEVQEFIQKLNQKTGKGYRLPSESEWEYACRTVNNQTYCGSENVDSVAAYNTNGGDKTQPAGSKQPNAGGLYDMSGNVWEWTQDCWNDNYNGAPSDGSGWTSGNCGLRVLRGGSWVNSASSTRAAIRGRDATANRNGSVGFRLARIAP